MSDVDSAHPLIRFVCDLLHAMTLGPEIPHDRVP